MTALYQFYNMEKSAHGQPFALCDEHRRDQKVPDVCVLQKIAEKAIEPCSRCADPDEDKQT